MKDPNQVLRQKEAALARVRKEIESLNIVAPLLAYEDQTPPDDRRRSFEERSKKPSTSTSDWPQAESEATGTDHQFSSEANKGSSFLNALKRAR